MKQNKIRIVREKVVDWPDTKSNFSLGSRVYASSTRSVKRQAATRLAKLEVRRLSVQIANDLRQAELEMKSAFKGQEEREKQQEIHAH